MEWSEIWNMYSYILLLWMETKSEAIGWFSGAEGGKDLGHVIDLESAWIGLKIGGWASNSDRMCYSKNQSNWTCGSALNGGGINNFQYSCFLISLQKIYASELADFLICSSLKYIKIMCKISAWLVQWFPSSRFQFFHFLPVLSSSRKLPRSFFLTHC